MKGAATNPRFTAWIFAGLAVAGIAAVAFAQGMAAPRRSARPSANPPSKLPPVKVDFRDVALESGVTATIVSGGEDAKKYILEATGTGVAVFDYDNDGWMDLFFVNATRFDTQERPTSHLYRNLGRLRFEDVTARAGLARTGWGQGVCAADYDNDGDRDLFVTYYGASLLYRNKGTGAFEDVTKSAGLDTGKTRWDTGCSFFDYDLDGRLDLMISGYVDFDRGKVPEPGAGGYCQWKGIPVMCGPRGLPPGRNFLYHNEGGGRFRDVSASSGIGAATGCYGFTVLSADFNGDGYPDAYVACDSTPSLLYMNLRDGRFEETGVASGVALNEDGQEQAGMGAAAADYDGDGDIDLVKTNFSDDTPNLYRNHGDGMFTDEVYPGGLGVHTSFLGWGINFIDVDHDGRRDLLIINGHVYPEVDRSPLGVKFRQPRLLYWNIGNGRFQDISATSGAGLTATWSSRGSATGDLDNDGSLEAVISNLGDRPSILKNYGPKKNWLLVRSIGVQCNRDAVGARVSVYAAGRRSTAEVQTGSSFLSQNDPRLHFGLGDAPAYDRIEVRWPGGTSEAFPGGPANRIVEIRQGSGRRRR